MSARDDKAWEIFARETRVCVPEKGVWGCNAVDAYEAADAFLAEQAKQATNSDAPGFVNRALRADVDRFEAQASKEWRRAEDAESKLRAYKKSYPPETPGRLHEAERQLVESRRQCERMENALDSVRNDRNYEYRRAEQAVAAEKAALAKNAASRGGS